MRLTVRGLLTLIFVLIAGMWLALRVYQTKSIDAIQQSVNFLSVNAERDSDEADDLAKAIVGYHALWKRVWQDPRRQDRRELEIVRKRFFDDLNKLNPMRFPASREPDLYALSKLYFEATRNSLESGIATESMRAHIEQLYQQIFKQVSGLQAVYEEAQQRIEDQGAVIVRTQRANDLAFLTVSLGGLALLTAAIWFLLGAPLTELARGMKRLSQESWKKPIPIRGFGEIASLIRAFNDMAGTIKKQKELLVTEANTDELTGLLNFRAFQDRVQEELDRAKRLEEPVSLILADIDFFKKFNDTRGHLAGNEALKLIATRLRKGCRTYDIVSRFGGEEFAVVLPETNLAQGAILAERLRKSVSADGFPLTISCGVASYPADASNLEALIAKADERLYRAKDEGRNRIVA